MDKPQTPNRKIWPLARLHRYAKHCGQVIGILLVIGYCLPGQGLLVIPVSYAVTSSLLESTLKDGIGVRPLGMGGAFVALASDANAAFYNPAGLADIGFSYLRGYLDYNHNLYDQNDCTLFTVGSFGLANWRVRTFTSGEVQISSYSYGRTDERGLSWGMTMKNVYGDLGLPEGRGWSVDFGLKALASPGLAVGVLFQDLIENINIPTSVRAGGAYRFRFLREGVLAAEAEVRNIRSKEGATVYPHYGLESWVSESLILRCGWERDRFTAGLTVGFPFLTLDYAQAIPATSSGETIHRVGIRLGKD